MKIEKIKSLSRENEDELKDKLNEVIDTINDILIWLAIVEPTFKERVKNAKEFVRLLNEGSEEE